MAGTHTLPYPRKVRFRRLARAVGRGFLRLLTETVVTGVEHLPPSGPLILVGNHIDALDRVMMALLAPWQVELLMDADVPPDPRFAWLVERYGTIPIQRGMIDRQGLNLALSVLRQGGVVGIFPEHDLGSGSEARGHAGAAWLSAKSNAPVVPIGFGGTHGALASALRFEHPKLVMNIGAPLAPETLDTRDRQALDAAAGSLMNAVRGLVPERDRWRYEPLPDAAYDFEVALTPPDGGIRLIYDDFSPQERAALGRFFEHPALRLLWRNLRLPVRPLVEFERERNPTKIATASNAIVDYVETIQPQFLCSRFGYGTGAAMLDGIIRLRAIARQAAENGEQMALKPVRKPI